jgi:hypothetical protein
LSRITFVSFAALYAAIHASAAAQSASPAPRSQTIPSPIAVQATTALVQPVESEDDEDITEVDTSQSLRYDLRVISLRGPISQTTSDGTPRQVVMVTVANFGYDSTAPARLSLDEDTHGRPLGGTTLTVPPLAPGGQVTLPVVITVPPNLQGQICFTGRLELASAPASNPVEHRR